MTETKKITKRAAAAAAAAAAIPVDNERAAMEKLYADTMKNLTEGSVIPGKILEISGDDVVVDIGSKSEGIIPLAEFKGIEDLKPGDVHDVLIESMDDETGTIKLSYQRAKEQQRWNRVVANCKEGSVVKGIVQGRVRGGLLVDVDGIEAFLPGSQVDIVPVQNPDDYLNREFEFKIIKINSDRKNIVVSRRELIEDQRRGRKRELLTELKVGQLRPGVVKNITDFGVFVDLDGMDGLLHITDMSWGRLNHPSELVKVGEPIEVMVLDVNLEKERVSLGLKQRQQNPWDNIENKYPVGSRLRGKVVSLMPYGAFVELEPGVEGLVHVSEMSWTKRVVRASDALKVAESVAVVVLTVNKADQKIGLGMRQMEENPWDGVRGSYPIGTRVTGTVRNLTSYGAFIELEDGIDGMVHVSDMSWTRKVNHPSEVLKKGDKISAVVLEVDPDNQRISLGLKQAQDDPWSSIAARYKIGQMVKGKVTKLASFGAFVELEDGIDGLVHISQISEDRVEKVKDVLKLGQEVQARVVRIDEVERKIGLSIKAAAVSDADFVVKDEMLQGLGPGEDLGDLAGVLDAAFGAKPNEDWHPGEKAAKDAASDKDEKAG